MNPSEIHSYVEEIIGVPTYLVGGSVRDTLLNKESKDYDFATAMLPDEVEAKVKAAGRRAYAVGKKFGTIGFKTPDGQYFIEVTTFRSEKYKDKDRKPIVEFSSDITADLSRRDFTINALAQRADGTIVDITNGVDDINNRIIRGVGNPTIRFKEDPLRMLRAARFASTLDFVIDVDTIKSAKKVSHRLMYISKERLTIELDKILMSDIPSIGLRYLDVMDLLKYIIPHLAIQVGYNQNSKYHSLELWEHTLMVVDNIKHMKDTNSLIYNDCLNVDYDGTFEVKCNQDFLELRWAALLHDVGKPYCSTYNTKTGYNNFIKHDMIGYELSKQIGESLKWSNDRIKNVSTIILNHLAETSPLKYADNLSK
jgi:tRNA nucleotidyltransferase (CCA-adding enzyme)